MQTSRSRKPPNFISGHFRRTGRIESTHGRTHPIVQLFIRSKESRRVAMPTSYPVGLCDPKPPGCAILSFHVPHRLCLVNAASILHPAVAAWFERQFHAPTAAQAQAWPAIRAGEHVLVAAPTGSGKTLAAFLAAIDSLVRQGLEGRLEDATQIVYVSPLKALSNDIEKNLTGPLAGIREDLRARG